ncbi:MAG: DegV family protein [Actinomycetota bacterium]
MASSTVRIITDSSCDLPDSVVRDLGIEVVPLFIRFGDDELIDREQLSTAEFWKRCSIVEDLPSTAAPSPGRFEQAIAKVAGEGATGVLVINLSGALSGTLQSAEVAVESMKSKVDVRVVDSHTVSMGLGAIVVACAEAARKGESLDAVEALAHDLSGRCKLWGALDTLENLKKGGRIGGAKAMLGTVLSIKPIIEVREGVVQEGGKQRTRSKALAFLVDKVEETLAGPGIQWLSVLHADCDDVQDFVEMLRVVYPGEIMIGEIGPVVGSHAGRGTIGVAFIEN